ncbi:MAG: DEAD/DEAH box helicase [Thermodesulfobacteriota bacterium]|nr:DEAD/DEAH box helicase [Thermodesulfobacteriota bacterium]
MKTRRYDRRRGGPPARQKAEAPSENTPFQLNIHKRVRPVLDRIGIPEPQPFVPDPYQVEALEKIEASDVLVTAPTGAGKTYIAIEAIKKIFDRGGRSWYASPLKALSNAKLEEFGRIFGIENVGILTGDRKENPDAPIIVGTTEILRNQLYDAMHRGEDLQVDLVVMDEAHYLGDEDRGVVWEEILIYLPTRVRLLLLSATIRNAQEICDWLEWLRHHPCRWVTAHERPVPLFPLFLFPHGELTPLSSRRGLHGPIREIDSRAFARRDFPDVARILDALRQANLLPAIFFMKSRSDCERAITLCPSKPRKPKASGTDDFHHRLRELLDRWPFLENHRHLPILKRCRVGAHHAGQLPHWKLLLEQLMLEGYLEAIFSTSTVAAGVNFPARTVVIPQSDRFNGREFVELSATDLLQMTGRAGRRGMDKIGFVLVVPGRYQNPELLHDLLHSPPDAIQSQIRVNFSMVLNLLLSHRPEEIRTLFSLSLATFQNLSQETETRKTSERYRKAFAQWLPDMACGSPEALAEVRPRYMQLQTEQKKARKALKRQTFLWSIQRLLHPGRLLLSRRGTPYLVVEAPEGDEASAGAVRLAFPLQWRHGAVRVHRIHGRRIQDIGEKLPEFPDLSDREGWEVLVAEQAERPFRSLFRGDTPTEEPAPVQAVGRDLKEAALAAGSLPCPRCALYGPCQKSTRHPFSRLIQNYFAHHAEIRTIQEELWRSFLHHFRFLQAEGYLDEHGYLTRDGLWASKLRLDQPLLISEGIRQGVFPEDDPALLAALIAPFVMDRERPGEMQLSALVWKYPELAKPFFTLLQVLHRLRERLQNEGFTTPPLPFWTVVVVYHWAKGEDWDTVRSLSGIDEGDLAMVVLRTADHLRQVESLKETHPGLAASAEKAIEAILREPVLVV